MKPLAELEVWFVAGTQKMYGDAVIAAVETHAREVAGALDGADEVPVRVRDRGVRLSPESIRRVCLEANADDSCVGLLIWMRTFSPGKIEAASHAMGHLSGTTYAARTGHRDAYDVLYGEYVRLHDLFGRGGEDVMRRVKRLRIEAAAVAPATA